MPGNQTRQSLCDSTLPRFPLRPAAAFFRAIIAGLERSRQRRALAQLSDSMLKDIGLTRAEAETESAKSWWRE
jgi:uncharacterized protein YjiS (DUF1127 family)